MNALLRVTMDTENRLAIEAHIEQLQDELLALISALDEVDGDCDLEPSICGGVNPDRSDVMDDREGSDVLDEGEPHDWDDEDSGDDEPSMGWATPTGGKPVQWQEGWGYHASGAGADHDE